MTPDQDERLVAAFERIATAIESASEASHHSAEAQEFRAMIADADLSLRFPPKKEMVEATITKVKTDEDLAEENISGEDAHEPISKWTTIGEREQAFQRHAPHVEESGARGRGPGPQRRGSGSETVDDSR